MAATTSFQKKARVRLREIPGTKPSLYNNQLLTSTGVPSLDNFLGGGLAVGTVMLVEEDVFGNYAWIMMKYFTAEAVMTGQSSLVASIDQDPQQLLDELPAPVLGETKTRDNSQANIEGVAMKIAWRYQNQTKVQSGQSDVKFGHYYDLTKTMERERVWSTDITILSTHELQDANQSDRSPFPMNPQYCQLLGHIRSKIDRGQFGTAYRTEKRNILRIVLHRLGSPLWGDSGGVKADGTTYDPSFPRFLLALRSIIRSSFATCLITVPSHLFQDSRFIPKLEKLCDTVIKLDSFAGSVKEKNPVFKEYHGLFNIIQLPCLNSLTSCMPDTLDLGFRLQRKKITVEKLHLPPEVSENVSRSQEDPASQFKSPKTVFCEASASAKLEF